MTSIANNGISSVAIIGCGWLGLPLARALLEDGIKIKGSTTNPSKLNELKNLGIEPYLLKVPSDTLPDPLLFDVDCMILNVPPGRRNPNVFKDYPLAISQIVDAFKDFTGIKRIIFVSSTSVYGESFEMIDETTPTIPSTDSGRALLNSEKIVVEGSVNNVVLRFGGLAGPGRHPGKFLAGKTGLSSGAQSINFLHLQDAIGVIRYFIKNDFGQELYNVVAPLHPRKDDFYRHMSAKAGLAPPFFESSDASYKREISVEKLLLDTAYKFKYPDPMLFAF
jgi:nucleoside-diphosphate-sugar epimerase